MKLLNLVYLNLIQLGSQVWLLPQTVANALKQRRLQVLRIERKAKDDFQREVERLEQEVERLDRIRNPSRYRLR
jgi:hypothetical protein